MQHRLNKIYKTFIIKSIKHKSRKNEISARRQRTGGLIENKNKNTTSIDYVRLRIKTLPKEATNDNL